MGKAHPFENDAEHLDDCATWLGSLAVLAAARREMRHAQDVHEAGEEAHRGPSVQQLRCREVSLREREEQLHRELLERLDAHRMSDKPTLGIDTICQESRLDDDERLVLVAVCIACVGSPVADRVFGDLCTCYRGGLQASDAAMLLGATEEPSALIRFRRLLLSDSPLILDRLIRFDRVPEGPEGLMDVTLTVTKTAFATVTGTEVEDYEPRGGQS